MQFVAFVEGAAAQVQQLKSENQALVADLQSARKVAEGLERARQETQQQLALAEQRKIDLENASLEMRIRSDGTSRLEVW
jgi:hypothetical protein